MLSLSFQVNPWLGLVGEVIQWVTTRTGGFGLMLLAMGDSSFLSVPEGNDVLLVMLSTGNTWENMAYYVAMTIAGSVSGCLLLYLVGRKGGSPLLRRRFSEKSLGRAERLFERFGVLTVFIPSILPPPCPFKIFVLSAGVFRLKIWEFLAAVVVGRTIRYSMWGVLAVLYGGAVKSYMQKNLPVLGIALFAALLLVIGVLAVAYVRRVRAGRLEGPEAKLSAR